MVMLYELGLNIKYHVDDCLQLLSKMLTRYIPALERPYSLVHTYHQSHRFCE